MCGNAFSSITLEVKQLSPPTRTTSSDNMNHEKFSLRSFHLFLVSFVCVCLIHLSVLVRNNVPKLVVVSAYAVKYLLLSTLQLFHEIWFANMNVSVESDNTNFRIIISCCLITPVATP